MINISKQEFSFLSIEELVSAYGSEAEKHLLFCCLAGVDLAGTLSGESSTKNASSAKDKDRDQHQLLTEYFGPRITQPGFPSLLSSVLDQSLRGNFLPKSVNHPLKNSSSLVTNFSRFLRLTHSQEVVLRIALLETFNPEARSQSLVAIQQKLCELFTNYVDQDTNTALESGLQVCQIILLLFFHLSFRNLFISIQENSPEVIHYILGQILSKTDHFGIVGDLLDNVFSSLRRDYPRELVPVILAPILYQDQGVESTSIKMAHEGNSVAKNMVENSLADLILETGYTFTSSIEECRSYFATFDLRELTAASLARAVSYMARTHTGLDEQTLRNLRSGNCSWSDLEPSGEKTEDGQPLTWNIEIFVQVDLS